MGMAAGQARLLSITTRMSDNELRAQIINNDKMRLASESSRVSENYVAALNESELMFTSYDANNNASYQNLTFNALTSYNPYNNQYALINSAGNILVSERDSQNFKMAGGDVNRFLKAYGLEYTTTYFDNLLGPNGEPVGYNSSSIVYYSTGEKDANGKLLVDQSSGFTAAQLEKMYRGIGETTMRGDKKIENHGYEQILQEGNYSDYQALLDTYNKKFDRYLEFVTLAMDETFNEVVKKIFDGKSVSEVANQIKTANNEKDMKAILLKLAAVPGSSKPYMYKEGTDYDEGNQFFSYYESLLKAGAEDTLTETYKQDEYTVLTDDNGNYYIVGKSKGKIDELLFKYNTSEKKFTEEDENGNSVEVTGLKNLDMEHCSKKEGSEALKDLPNWAKDLTLYECSGTFGDFTYTYKNSLKNMQSIAEGALQNLKQGIYTVWDAMNPKWQTTDAAKDAYNDFKDSAIELGKFMFGSNYSGNSPKIEDLGDVSKMYNDGPGFTETMNSVFQALVLDAIMNTYGEPNYSWIDTSSRTDSYNENAEKKAQWYQNLFNRMTKGYAVLLDGLASSADWIKFAFENGIVTMEQIDALNAWNSLSYTNCSDIREETKDKAVTKAEAEYKAAMNKIENKDKQYDLELKNIDTEHNSLQTEYDSIKEAINKNVERVFKMYA